MYISNQCLGPQHSVSDPYRTVPINLTDEIFYNFKHALNLKGIEVYCIDELAYRSKICNKKSKDLPDQTGSGAV